MAVATNLPDSCCRCSPDEIGCGFQCKVVMSCSVDFNYTYTTTTTTTYEPVEPPEETPPDESTTTTITASGQGSSTNNGQFISFSQYAGGPGPCNCYVFGGDSLNEVGTITTTTTVTPGPGGGSSTSPLNLSWSVFYLEGDNGIPCMGAQASTNISSGVSGAITGPCGSSFFDPPYTSPVCQLSSWPSIPMIASGNVTEQNSDRTVQENFDFEGGPLISTTTTSFRESYSFNITARILSYPYDCGIDLTTTYYTTYYTTYTPTTSPIASGITLFREPR